MRTDIPRIPPRRLVFSGGGMRVLSYLGVIQVLQEHKLLSNVRELCGVSAGALIALMLGLGYSFHVFERFCFEFDFSILGGIDFDTILDSIEQYGLNSGEKLKALIAKILYHKGFGPDTTFGELQASGKAKLIRIWASDIQYLKPIEFSATKTPNIPIVIGLYASMTLPMYYTPLRHPETNTMLLDGGVFDNYPISYLSESEAEESLGCTFEHKTLPAPVHDISSYIALITSGYYIPSYKVLIEKHKCRTIIVKCQEFPSTKFEITQEERQMLVSLGRQAAEIFLQSQFPSNSLRRNSVS
jgi:predicted acylesterase/phospholipase RssA